MHFKNMYITSTLYISSTLWGGGGGATVGEIDTSWYSLKQYNFFILKYIFIVTLNYRKIFLPHLHPQILILHSGPVHVKRTSQNLTSTQGP